MENNDKIIGAKIVKIEHSDNDKTPYQEYVTVYLDNGYELSFYSEEFGGGSLYIDKTIVSQSGA